MNTASKFVLAALSPLLLVGCIRTFDFPPTLTGGTLNGEVALVWNDKSDFVYAPIVGNELTYTFPLEFRISDDDAVNGNPKFRSITPLIMPTDAGSIPRPFWGIEGLSPWDYLPAYMIHDWLYYQKGCWNMKPKQGVYARLDTFPYSRQTADKVLFDSLDLIDKESKTPNETARTLIRTAVANFGGDYWKKANCPPSPKPLRSLSQRTEVQAVRRTAKNAPVRTFSQTKTVTVSNLNYEIIRTVKVGN